jgi:hypothetical protein
MFSMKSLVYVNNHKHARFQVSDAKVSAVSVSMAMVPATEITSDKLNADKIYNPLNPELNPICQLAHHFLHVSRIRVKSLTFRLLMSCIYVAHILDVSR